MVESASGLHLNAGSYTYTDENNNEQICRVLWDSGKLIVDGLPQGMEKNRLTAES
jgi:hypothetical protein